MPAKCSADVRWKSGELPVDGRDFGTVGRGLGNDGNSSSELETKYSLLSNINYLN